MEIEVHEDVIVKAYKENNLDQLFQSIKNSVEGLVFDMNTEKGRKECASVAYAISRSKTAVDDYGKELVSGIKAQAKLIDQIRKPFRDQCDELRDSIRAPLNAYEEEIQAQKDAMIAKVNSIKDCLNKNFASVFEIDLEIQSVKQIDVSEEVFGELSSDARLVRFETIESLEARKPQLEEALRKQAEYEAQLIKGAEMRAQEAERRAKEAEDRYFKEIEAKKASADASKEHKRNVHRGIIDALCAWGALDEDQSKDLIRKIHNEEIPNIQIKY